jgi:type VI secretion system protein ImpK
MSQSPYRPADGDRTVVRPMPGGRPVHPQQATDVAAPHAATAPARESATYALPQASCNPILAAASPLLSIAPQIRSSAMHADPQRLKDELTHGLQRFELRLGEAGVPHATVVAARYVLCTFLDECAASTPWGSAGVWARDTLLVRLHNETWGGDKVFQLLNRLAQSPKANADLLELIYVCLSLGFEGRYRVAENGRSYLETIRERLYQMLKEQRGAAERSLSVKWKPALVESHRWFEMTPLWVFLAFCLAAMATGFLTYRMLLNARSDPVFAMLQGIRPVTVMAAPQALPAPTPPPAQPRLRRFLEPEIAAGLVAVQENADKSVITIRGDGIFEPGSAQVNRDVRPLLDRIAAALREHPGMVLVSGHTDSRPIRSVRFPSNFHLSQERAEGVGRILADAIGPARVRAQGKAESEPIAPNDTPAGRARNRRVTIVLLAGQARTE